VVGGLLEDMAEIWNGRFQEEEYIYGKEPNEFFKAALERFNPKGAILLAGEGEGRNAVYAARRGLRVCAFDISEQAKAKALRLAEAHGVLLDYSVGDFLNMPYADGTFSVAAIIYSHFHLSMRAAYHAKINRLIQSGGLLVLEGFSADNPSLILHNPIACARGTQACYTIAEIEKDFANFEVLRLCEEAIHLRAGVAHKGKAKVIRFLGRKR
jgi:ubiquinone/menaquinone biosynthesis C-methylase UbiE